MLEIKALLDKKPLVLNIQHFCLQDGPGIRSVIFFKGCPLRCSWCHNPESWSLNSEIVFKKHICIACEQCSLICPHGALLSQDNIKLELCKECQECTNICPSGALERLGRIMSVEEIMAELCGEFIYFKNSGGGVTFSGGETMLFPHFIKDLASKLKGQGLNISIETSGYFNLHNNINDLLNFFDLILYDIKIFDDILHKKYCGASNKIIKENFMFLSNQSKKVGKPKIWPRLPLIPGISNTKENLSAWAEFLLNQNIDYLSLIPYHEMGEGKRNWLREAQEIKIAKLEEKDLDLAIDFLRSKGINVYLPGEEDWTLLSN